jgi:hypothetical protein
MTETLEQVLADERGDAAVMRAKGFTREAEMVEKMCDRFATAAADFLDWLSEDEAMLRSIPRTRSSGGHGSP